MMKVFRNLVYVLFAFGLLVSCDSDFVYTGDGVAISKANFPDATFRNYIKRTFDTDGDGGLSADEIERARNVHCENMGIKSVKGIEFLTELRGLWCLNNHISDWNLSGNPHLKGIWCSHNDFKSLDFSACPELEWVYCFNCKLESLNLRNNPELAYLECNANPNLRSIDLSQNPKLENLFCSECSLTSLDLSANPMLCELAAFKNKLSSIDFSGNRNLKRLDIWYNENLGDVDISMLSGLQYYNCAKNNVTRLDMRNNPELMKLVCSYNDGLSYLNLRENPRLSYLDLQCDVSLSALDISENPKLYHLYAFGLRVPSIDISRNSRLLKTLRNGTYRDEPQNGDVHSFTLDFGGSGDPFDELKHELALDNGVNVITDSGTPSDVPDSYIKIPDGHSPSEDFATRGEAIAALYEKAGRPSVRDSSRFTDISSSPYEAAIKWGEQNKICFGYQAVCSDTFCPEEMINREDFALMAHRFAGYKRLGTAFDYGRTDWFDDFYDIDFYGWGAFTWAMQWEVLKPTGNYCYPHGRMTRDELAYSVEKIFHLSDSASYSERVNGNGE